MSFDQWCHFIMAEAQQVKYAVQREAGHFLIEWYAEFLCLVPCSIQGYIDVPQDGFKSFTLHGVTFREVVPVVNREGDDICGMIPVQIGPVQILHVTVIDQGHRNGPGWIDPVLESCLCNTQKLVMVNGDIAMNGLYMDRHV